jgi:hypothetical protein
MIPLWAVIGADVTTSRHRVSSKHGSNETMYDPYYDAYELLISQSMNPFSSYYVGH